MFLASGQTKIIEVKTTQNQLQGNGQSKSSNSFQQQLASLQKNSNISISKAGGMAGGPKQNLDVIPTNTLQNGMVIEKSKKGRNSKINPIVQPSQPTPADEGPTITCPKCPERFWSKQRMEFHYIQLHNPIKCAHCNMDFGGKDLKVLLE